MLNIQYINVTKSVLAYSLSILDYVNLTDHDYEPKGQEFGCTPFEHLPPVANSENSTDTTSVNVLESTTENT